MIPVADDDRALIALAAVFAPAAAPSLASRLAADPGDALRSALVHAASRPRGERLAALGSELDAASLHHRPNDGRRAAPRTSLRVETRVPSWRSAGTVRETVRERMALPFDMPPVSLGFALLTPGTRALGARAAAASARALGGLTGGVVQLSGRALPCVPAPCVGALPIRVELTALPGAAAIEVEASLAVALLDRLSGGDGSPKPATSVTPLERGAVELGLLAALDAIASLPEIEGKLAPRLARTSAGPLDGLAVDLSVSFGGRPGRARLTLPAAAMRALTALDASPGPAAEVAIELSLRGGASPVTPEEVAALEPGDVVLLDRAPSGRLRAVAPGGLSFEGTESEAQLTIEEIRMTDAASEWPIALEVELARLPITLGELARLEVGAVLPLPVDRRGLVTLKLGDRTLGRGQLVDVEGAVGVRIESLVEARR